MDKIGDMLTTIKNAGQASKASVVIPYSNLKHSIADCLSKRQYVGAVSKKTDKKDKPVLEIVISYEGKFPKVSKVERIFLPSIVDPRNFLSICALIRLLLPAIAAISAVT